MDRLIRGNNRLVYLDSGATSQKPVSVLDAEREFYTKHNAAAHRGAHQLAEEATELFEGAREKVADFLGAKSEAIVNTTAATESRTRLEMHYLVRIFILNLEIELWFPKWNTMQT